MYFGSYIPIFQCNLTSYLVNYAVYLITGLVVPQVKCQELYSHMLRDPTKGHKKPWLSVERTVDPETRYMDLCAAAVQTGTTVLLVAGCSDGFLR
jgi:hypothetical protein